MPAKSQPEVFKARVESEAAGYIRGKTKEERRQNIRSIWSHIVSSTAHFRAPKLQPRSCPSLIASSQIETRRSELQIDERSQRHIIYLDTLDLALRRAEIQVRLERKRKPKKVDLKKAFYEVTIKIGDKAEERLEDAVRVNLKTWQKKGFMAAIRGGIEAEVKYVRKKKGKEEAKKRRGELKALIKEFKKRAEKTSAEDIDKIRPLPLVHLNRNTKETEYTPNSSKKTVLELKTDDCDFETMLGDTGHFAQIEIEHITGPKKAYKRELKALMSGDGFGIEETADSKEDAAMRAIEPFLLPQADTEAEKERVEHNRQVLIALLDPIKFDHFGKSDHDIRAPKLAA